MLKASHAKLSNSCCKSKTSHAAPSGSFEGKQANQGRRLVRHRHGELVDSEVVARRCQSLHNIRQHPNNNRSTQWAIADATAAVRARFVLPETFKSWLSLKKNQIALHMRHGRTHSSFGLGAICRALGRAPHVKATEGCASDCSR
jgi:hypothetical protein